VSDVAVAVVVSDALGEHDGSALTAVGQACRALRLPTVRSPFAEMLDAAEKEQLTTAGSSPNSCSPGATTGTAAAPPAGSKARRVPARQVDRRLRF
jgi:hypothetical protein